MSLGECAFRKVHALFLFHLFQSCAFSVSLLSPSNPYQWEPAWPRWASGLSNNQAMSSFQSHLCISCASEHVHSGILVLSWGGQLPGPPAARLGMGSRSLSLWFIASHLSYPQHFNLVSTCHTQAYWIISLSLLILVSLIEIVITVIVCWAINYGDCKAYLFISLSIHGLIGNIHVLFSLPIIWIAAINHVPPLYCRVRADYHCTWCPVPAQWERTQGQCAEKPVLEGAKREKVCLPPLSLHKITIALPN